MIITQDNLDVCKDLIYDFLRVNFFNPRHAWLVGSAARLIDKKIIKEIHDIDIVIEEQRWHQAEIGKVTGVISLEKTGFGDWKGTFPNGLVVDFIFKSVGRFLQTVPTAWDGIAINLHSDAVLYTKEYLSEKNFEITGRFTRKPNYKPYYIEHLRKQGIERE